MKYNNTFFNYENFKDRLINCSKGYWKIQVIQKVKKILKKENNISVINKSKDFKEFKNMQTSEDSLNTFQYSTEIKNLKTKRKFDFIPQHKSTIEQKNNHKKKLIKNSVKQINSLSPKNPIKEDPAVYNIISLNNYYQQKKFKPRTFNEVLKTSRKLQNYLDYSKYLKTSGNFYYLTDSSGNQFSEPYKFDIIKILKNKGIKEYYCPAREDNRFKRNENLKNIKFLNFGLPSINKYFYSN